MTPRQTRSQGTRCAASTRPRTTTRSRTGTTPRRSSATSRSIHRRPCPLRSLPRMRSWRAISRRRLAVCAAARRVPLVSRRDRHLALRGDVLLPQRHHRVRPRPDARARGLSASFVALSGTDRHCREYLGISPEEYDLLFTKMPSGSMLPALYGFLETDENWMTTVRHLSEFLLRTGLTYCEFLELWPRGASSSTPGAGRSHSRAELP